MTYQLPIYGRVDGKCRIVGYATIPDDLFTRTLVIPFRWSKHSKNTGYLTSHLGTSRGKTYLHRLLYVIYYGPIPEGKEIDHADTDQANNMPSNLRAVTHGANIVNSGRCGLSGIKGVRRMRDGWQARIQRDGIVHYLGVYSTKEDAANPPQCRKSPLSRASC